MEIRHHPYSRARLEGMMWLNIHDVADDKQIDVSQYVDEAIRLTDVVVKSEWARIYPMLQSVEDGRKREKMFNLSAYRAATVFVDTLINEGKGDETGR